MDVFFSYHGADREAVEAVRTFLVARGIATFVDRHDLPKGLPWPEALERALRGTRAVAVFLGPEGFGTWQRREVGFALDRQAQEEKTGKDFPVIPVLLKGAEPTTGFLFLNTWIDLRSGVDDEGALADLEQAVSGESREESSRAFEHVHPYRGLQAFDEEDAAFFFGRESFGDRLLKKTLEQDVVAVIGPSGSGKSSVVRAGLLPRLRRQRPPNPAWDAVRFNPWDRPFHRLASALTPMLEPDLGERALLREAKALGDDLMAGRILLEDVVERVLDRSGGSERLLVVADQFEELFTQVPAESRRPFVEALLGSVGRAPLTLVLTLRADFYGSALAVSRQLSDRLEQGTINLGRMEAEELRRVVEKPATRLGVTFEPGLVDLILRDVGDEPGKLPLLQFALTQLWEKRRDRRLTTSAYNEIGSVKRAIATKAEEEFSKLTSPQQQVAARLFTRMVRVARPEEGASDVRRRVRSTDLEAGAGELIDRLAGPAVRLLVTGREISTGEQTVELAHEAMIQHWRRLQKWLDGDREFLVWRQGLRPTLEDWEDSGRRDAGCLLRGGALRRAERWWTARRRQLSAGERALIERSRGRRGRARAAAVAAGLAILFGFAAFFWDKAQTATADAIFREFDQRSELRTEEHLAVWRLARAGSVVRTRVLARFLASDPAVDRFLQHQDPLLNALIGIDPASRIAPVEKFFREVCSIESEADQTPSEVCLVLAAEVERLPPDWVWQVMEDRSRHLPRLVRRLSPEEAREAGRRMAEAARGYVEAEDWNAFVFLGAAFLAAAEHLDPEDLRSAWEPMSRLRLRTGDGRHRARLDMALLDLAQAMGPELAAEAFDELLQLTIAGPDVRDGVPAASWAESGGYLLSLLVNRLDRDGLLAAWDGTLERIEQAPPSADVVAGMVQPLSPLSSELPVEETGGSRLEARAWERVSGALEAARWARHANALGSALLILTRRMPPSEVGSAWDSLLRTVQRDEIRYASAFAPAFLVAGERLDVAAAGASWDALGERFTAESDPMTSGLVAFGLAGLSANVANAELLAIWGRLFEATQAWAQAPGTGNRSRESSVLTEAAAEIGRRLSPADAEVAWNRLIPVVTGEAHWQDRIKFVGPLSGVAERLRAEFATARLGAFSKAVTSEDSRSLREKLEEVQAILSVRAGEQTELAAARQRLLETQDRDETLALARDLADRLADGQTIELLSDFSSLPETARTDRLCQASAVLLGEGKDGALKAVVENVLKWPTCTQRSIAALLAKIVEVDDGAVGAGITWVAVDRWALARWAQSRGFDHSSVPD